MKKFESPMAQAAIPVSEIYKRCSSFEQLGNMMPEQITNWDVQGDECSFEIQGMASVVLRFKDRIPERKVTIASVKAPFSLEL
jgi:hypothetical protein